MKRSNRLVLLVGIFLAVVAFVAIFLYLSGSGGEPGPDEGPRNTTDVVVAAQDIPLGTQITADLVTVDEDVPINEVKSGYFISPNLVIGEITRQPILAGQQLTSADFSSSNVTQIDCPPTLRCLAVQVDQVTGVGTLIRAGDYVDVVVGFTGDKFPVVTVNPDDDTITPVAGISGTTVKLLLQGLQVQAVLLPPPPAQDGTEGDGTTTDGDQPTNLTGQQEIVILGANAQQAEIIKFAQMDGSISLALRAADDFRDPNDPTIPVTPVPDVTSGIILKELVDTYGVLVPEIIELILPEAAAP